MTTFSDAIESAVDAAATGVPATFSALVEYVGGTRQAAAQLGVSQRQVERLRAYDIKSQTTTEQRGKRSLERHTKTLQEQAGNARWEDLKERVRTQGLTTYIAGTMRVSKRAFPWAREVHISDEEDLDALMDALQTGDTVLTEDRFNEAYMHAYGVPGGAWETYDTAIIRFPW